jgi:hypothetical protein
LYHAHRHFLQRRPTLLLPSALLAQEPENKAMDGSLPVQPILTRFQKSYQEPSTGPSEKGNARLRMECLVKLVRIGSPAVPVLIESLRDQKRPACHRALAAQALGFLGDARARPALLEAKELKELGRLGRLEATPELRELAGKDPTRGIYFDVMFLLTRDDEPKPEPIRRALRNYDMARMDSAQLGKPAPDFTLADASGKTWQLGQFRGKKAVVLILLIGIN